MRIGCTSVFLELIITCITITFNINQSCSPCCAEASNCPVENPDHKETLKELQRRYSNRWYAIGKELGFTADELSRINEMAIPQCDKLLVVFDQKVTTNGKAKAWDMFCQACESIYKPAEE
jgi:hypothetical protein